MVSNERNRCQLRQKWDPLGQGRQEDTDEDGGHTCRLPSPRKLRVPGRVQIDDALNLKLEVKQKKKLEAQLTRATWIFGSQELDPAARYHVW